MFIEVCLVLMRGDQYMLIEMCLANGCLCGCGRRSSCLLFVILVFLTSVTYSHDLHYYT